MFIVVCLAIFVFFIVMFSLYMIFVLDNFSLGILILGICSFVLILFVTDSIPEIFQFM